MTESHSTRRLAAKIDEPSKPRIELTQSEDSNRMLKK
jgi:hypothetical protein